MKFTDRIKHAWNAFTGSQDRPYDYGLSTSLPSHTAFRRYNTSAFASAIFNRIALDVASTSIHHVKIDEETEDRTTVKSGLHNCLNVEANIDQTGMQFLQDIVYSMFDEGVVAVVPVETTVSPNVSGAYNILSMRVGRIVQWYPQHVRVSLYNEEKGKDEEVTLSKRFVGVVENPLYAVTNGPNATLSRLLAKMSLIDDVDTLVASGKLDLIIQLPYAVKTELQRTQAAERVKNLEAQISSNKTGVAYVDATEKFTQLSRPINTKLLEDIQFLSQQFYNQLGLTENVFNGTANELELRSYYTRTVDPIIDAIIAEFNRKFISKTARAQGHTLESYRDPFTLVPIEQIANIADTFRRNSILSSNELRGIVGYRQSSDPKADELFNPNIAESNQKPALPGPVEPPTIQNDDKSQESGGKV